MTAALLAGGAWAYGLGWELRRRAYARGVLGQVGAGLRVVSVGNLTVGGTGKTTLCLHLARRALERGIEAGVVCRRYRPGPRGEGDEERLYLDALGPSRVFAGTVKRRLARAAAAAGMRLAIVDDGFSHWRLARDVDIVLLDAHDLWGGGELLPAGRLREPLRALQRAHALVVTRLGPGEDPAPWIAASRPYAPGALTAAGRHRVIGVRDLDGVGRAAGGAARVVTATGSPEAVARSATEAGFEVLGVSRYRDHHWFGDAEAAIELARAAAAGAALLLTAKDAVRWPAAARDPRVAVLEVAWEWVCGGDAVERLAFGAAEAAWTSPTS